METLVWEESDDEPPPAVPGPPERETLSAARKFVYFLIALSPFIAFVLLLPRGGEDGPAAEEPRPTPPISRRAVPLAFPFESPTPVTDLPSPESVVLESPAAQCSDGIDNDGDGRRDYPADPGCSSSNDNVESSGRRTPAPPPPPPPSPAPAPAPVPPPPPEEPPPPSPSPPPPPVFPPPGPLDCEPPFHNLPGCPGNDNDSQADEEPAPDPEDSTD